MANPSVCGKVPAEFGQGSSFYIAKQLLATHKKKLLIRASRRPASYEASYYAVFFILPLLPPFQFRTHPPKRPIMKTTSTYVLSVQVTVKEQISHRN